MRPAATRIVFTLLALSLSAGCVDDAPEVFITGNKILADDCVIDAGLATSNVSRTSGIFDVFLATRSNASSGTYAMVPAVLNTLVPARTLGVDGEAPGIDGADWPANTVIFDRAEITYEFPEGLDVDVSEEGPVVRFADTLEAGEAKVLSLVVMNRELAEALSESDFLRRPRSEFQMLVNVRIFGRTAGQRSVASNEFTYPVTVCNGCLVNFPTAANDPTAEVTPNCRNVVGDEDTFARPCNVGQDESVDCRAVCPFIVQSDLDTAGICEARLD